MMETIAATARVWVYQSNRKINDSEWQFIEDTLQNFMKEWNAHGNSLTATFEIRAPYHFALIVDESETSASGCSIDSSVHMVKELEQKLEVSFFERQNIVYASDDHLQLLPLPEFIDKVKSGELSENVQIADILVSQYADWQDHFLKPVKESWLGPRV